MHGQVMTWQIYTRLVEIDAGVALRWFWRDREGRQSPESFIFRDRCEADASRHGYARSRESADQRLANHWTADGEAS